MIRWSIYVINFKKKLFPLSHLSDCFDLMSCATILIIQTAYTHIFYWWRKVILCLWVQNYVWKYVDTKISIGLAKRLWIKLDSSSNK
jgi:hypothetical protein